LSPWHLDLEATGGFDAIAIGDDGRVATTWGGVTLAANRKVLWTKPVAGARAVAFSGGAVVVAVTGTGEGFRGDPGAALIGLAGADGAETWRRPIGATGWVVVRAVAALPGGDLVAVGSFNGTMRAGDEVVSAGGLSDGFAVRVGPAGEVRWLIRIGGERGDAIAAVAAAPGTQGGVVVGGTFTGTADARARVVNRCSASCGVSTEVGSSRMSRRGFCSRHRTISMRCRSPADKVQTARSASSASP
jgi:hypothetical protein